MVLTEESVAEQESNTTASVPSEDQAGSKELCIKKNAQQIWAELHSDLNLLPELITNAPLPEDEDSLKTQALLIWGEHEKCETALAPILYELNKKIQAKGKKGQGFYAWLKANGKSPSTAYRWMRKYARKNGFEPPASPSTKKDGASTLCQVAQPLTESLPPDVDDYVPAPTSIDTTKVLLWQFFQKLDKETRSTYASMIIGWITSEVLNDKMPLPEHGE